MEYLIKTSSIDLLIIIVPTITYWQWKIIINMNLVLQKSTNLFMWKYLSISTNVKLIMMTMLVIPLWKLYYWLFENLSTVKKYCNGFWNASSNKYIAFGLLNSSFSVGQYFTLYETRRSDKSSYPTYDIHFLKQNDMYFHVGYAK